MKKLKRLMINMIFILGLCGVIWFVLLQNPKFIVQNEYYQKAYNGLAYQWTVHQDLVKIDDEQEQNLMQCYKNFLTSDEIDLLQQKKIVVLQPDDVLLREAQGKEIDEDIFPILVYTSYEKKEDNLGAEMEKLSDVVRAAHNLHIKVIVDCSYADRLRRMPEGFNSILLCKQYGIRRIVVFDGGHHLASLALNPDFILLPLTTVGNHMKYVNHAFMRDAIPLNNVSEIVNYLELDTVMMHTSRIRTIAKTKGSMGELARQLLLKGDKAREDLSVMAGEYQGGLSSYSIDQVQARDCMVIAPKQTAMIYISQCQQEDAENILGQIEKQVIQVLNDNPIKTFYIAIDYGDSTIKSLGKKIVNPGLLEEGVKKIAEEKNIKIKIVNIPYSGWDLYWQKMIDFVKQKKDLVRQILSFHL